MDAARRYIEVVACVDLWMAFGWIFHHNPYFSRRAAFVSLESQWHFSSANCRRVLCLIHIGIVCNDPTASVGFIGGCDTIVINLTNRRTRPLRRFQMSQLAR